MRWPALPRLALLLLILTATGLLSLGIFAPCLKILPGFGSYSPLVRILYPALTQPTSFSLFEGIRQLAHGGYGLLAALLFAFSVVFPLAKLTTYWIAALHAPGERPFRLAFLTADRLGRFSMVDVFVIALLVIAIKGLPGSTQVVLQWGFWCFCGAILLSLFIPFLLGARRKTLTDQPKTAP